jgi:hypothetical protein
LVPILVLVLVLVLASGAALATSDLSVGVTATPLTVQPGVSGADLVDFTVRVTNGGPDRADAVVTHALSAGLVIPTGLSAVASQGFYDPLTGRWDVGSLRSGETATLQVPARAVAGASGCLGDRVTVTLVAGPGANDPQADNDSAQAYVGAPVCADLRVTAAVEQSRNGSCIDARQVFSITNRGSLAATDVRLVITRYEVTAPGNFSETSCTGGPVTVPGPRTVSVGNLASGETRQIETGLSNLDTDGPDITVAYAANVAGAEPDPDAANGSVSGSYLVDRGGAWPGSDGSGTVCIFTSALRDTRFADKLPLLRRFRDRYLMTNAPGRGVVAAYERISPALVTLLDRHDWARPLVHTALVPVLFGVLYPAAVLILMLTALAGFTWRRSTRIRVLQACDQAPERGVIGAPTPPRDVVSMRAWPIAALVLLASLGADLAQADVFRPAYLELRELGANRYDVLWKVPARGELRLAITVQFPDDVREIDREPGRFVGDAYVERWRIERPGGLVGQSIAITGEASGVSDVIARVERADGTSQVERLSVTQTRFVVLPAAGTGEIAWSYLVLGVEHILGGIDHLLFVLALLLIVRGGGRIVATVTAFTLAHSLTLVAATLGWVHVPGAPVEAMIALSIVFVAAEIVRGLQGRPGLTAQAPWIVAFAFGLLHGLGFAGALAEVGLPQKAIPVALLMFNVGVELGQLFFVAAALAAGAVVTRLLPRPAWLAYVLPYAIGAIAMYWVIERVGSFA